MRDRDRMDAVELRFDQVTGGRELITAERDGTYVMYDGERVYGTAAAVAAGERAVRFAENQRKA